jgi:hypothetical protein
MYHAAKLGYSKLQPLVQQLIAACLLNIAAGRSVIIDL